MPAIAGVFVNAYFLFGSCLPWSIHTWDSDFPTRKVMSWNKELHTPWLLSQFGECAVVGIPCCSCNNLADSWKLSNPRAIWNICRYILRLHPQGGPGLQKQHRGGFFFPRNWQPPPPLITCYPKKNIAFFVFSTNISQYLTIKTAPRPYVHVFVCGYGSHTTNPLMHA